MIKRQLSSESNAGRLPNVESLGPSFARPWLLHVARGFWIALVAVVAVKGIARPTMKSVYPQYAAAGRIWFEDQAEAPQNIHYLRRQYGPCFGVLIQPFCWLPDRWGGLAWNALSFTMLLTGFRHFLQVFAPQWSAEQRAIAYLIMPWWGLASFYNAQVNLLLVASLLWGVSLLAQKRAWLAGIWLTFPASIKAYPAALILLLAVRAPWQLVKGAVGGVGVLLAPLLWPGVAEGGAAYADWFRFLTSGDHFRSGYLATDVRRFLAVWVSDIRPTTYLWVQMGTGGLILLACLAARRRGGAGRRSLVLQAYMLTSLWFVAFGPATEEATFVLAGPAVAYLVVATVLPSPSRWDVALALAAVALGGPLQTSLLGETVRKGVFAMALAPVAPAYLFGRQLWWTAFGSADKGASITTHPADLATPPRRRAA